MNCQPRSCGRLAPNSAMIGESVPVAAMSRSGATHPGYGSPAANAITSSLPPKATRAAKHHHQTAASVVPVKLRRTVHNGANPAASNTAASALFGMNATTRPRALRPC